MTSRKQPQRRPCKPQQPIRRPVPAALALALAAWVAPTLSHAQDNAARGGGLTPTLGASLTYQRGQGLGGGAGDGEFVARLSPGLNWSSRSGRVQGSADYALDAVQYSKRDDSSALDHRLNALMRAELIEDRAFVELQGTAGQVAISPTGQLFAFDPLLGDANRTQVVNLRVTPTLLGRLGNVAEWQLRVGASITDARGASNADSNNRFALLQLGSPRGAGKLGWVLQAQRQDVSFRNGRDTSTERLNAQLNWRPDIDWFFFVTGGTERTDVGRLISRSYDNYGAGLAWTPSPRTRVSLQGEDRYFGSSWGATLEYRTARTIWRYTDTRDATDGGDPNGFSQPITLFELFFLQFASAYPDPVQRDLAVREFLRLIGRDPNELLNIGALAEAVSLQRRQELSAAWNGRRTTVTVQLFATTLRALDNPSDPGSAPLADSPRQLGVNTNVSYRLTPTESLTASLTHQTSPGGGSNASNRLNGISLGYNTRFGRDTSASLALRHSEYSSDTVPYKDTSLSASVNMRF